MKINPIMITDRIIYVAVNEWGNLNSNFAIPDDTEVKIVGAMWVE